MTEQKSLPVTPEKLFFHLEKMGISYELHHHEPLFTVEDGLEVEKGISGTHCRNLFLRDKKKAMFLVVLANETKVDLKNLADLLGSGRLSFGSAERLWEHLGIRPGSVNPFCIMNDKAGAVRIILDRDMMASDRVNYHPMDNAMTMGLSPDDLIRFINETGHKPEVLDLKPAAP
ncbi:MAG: prolyl-tRNA synthetase associated domain-containing protein [Alphaproteobacteria bacterium]|nr:prolyl-tRNA synthetase associated domain-containing protein [Alphaproteobacteria bacterium]